MESIFILYKENPKPSIQRGKEGKKEEKGKKKERRKRWKNLVPSPSATLSAVALGLQRAETGKKKREKKKRKKEAETVKVRLKLGGSDTYSIPMSCHVDTDTSSISKSLSIIAFANYFSAVEVIINQPILVSNFLMVLAYVALILPPCCNRICYQITNPLFETIIKSHVLCFASFLFNFYKATWFAIVMFLGQG